MSSLSARGRGRPHHRISGADSQFGVEFGRVVEDAVFYGDEGFADVADVLCGVAVDQDEVGEFAGSDGAEIFIHAHDAGGVEGGVLQDDVGGDAGLDVEFEFAMEGESGHAVGAVFDGEAGAVEKSGEFEHFGEGFFVGVVHAWGRSHAGGEKAAADLGGETVGHGFESGRNLAGVGHVLVFENAEGEVEFGVVSLQELDEGLDGGGVEVERGGEFSGFGEAGDGVGVFDFGEEVENEKVDVLDFVVAELDALRSDHVGRDVSTDAESVFVGFVDDDRDELGLDRAVDFDLRVAEFFVVVDGGAGFGFGGDEDFGGSVKGVGAVDDSGEDDAGADFFSVGDALAAGEERVGVVGEIADGGDSGGEVEEAVVVADVGVHIPEAGEEGFVGGVDDLDAGRQWSRDVVDFDRANPVAGDEDRAIVQDLAGFGIEEIRVVEEKAGGMVSEFGG